MTTAHTEALSDAESLEPLVVHRSVDRTGATYALDRRARERLRELYGSDRSLPPRVFIAHETGTDYERIHGTVRNLVVQLLTGLSEERLQALGPIEFVDPVTEQRLA